MHDEEAIRSWVAQSEAEVLKLAEEADAVQQRLADARRHLALMYELLAAVTNAPVEFSSKPMGIGGSVRHRVQRNAELILRDQQAPMTVQAIHAEFVRRRMPLPGRGAPTNIAAHLVASDRFARGARGMYGLSEWNQPSTAGPPPAARVAQVAPVAEELMKTDDLLRDERIQSP